MIYRLNASQRFLLQSLVHFIREGKLKEPIGTFPLGNPPTAYAIHLRGEDSFVFENVGDLDVLCQVGMLGFQWNRTGMGKLYFVTEAGETAVLHNFQLPSTPIGFDVYLPDVIHAMSGGQLMVKGLPEVALSDVVADVKLRRVLVEVLVERLVTAVYTLLSKEDFVTYKAIAQQFADCLLHMPATESDLKHMYHTLAFWDDLAIETKYMTQAQPLLYALWLVAAVRIDELKKV
ncbi:MAG: hypothetical protein H6658_14475 [Ardenticatenaceae bacterium]|nr:hypothetical protein [Ardenticatenaceae bacterium]